MFSPLSQIAYELIEGDFWFGKYGPFNVTIHSKTGYINATKLCGDGGKQFRHWKENKSSQELIAALSDELMKHAGESDLGGIVGIPTNPLFIEKGLSSRANVIKGTYAHPLLIPHIAGWCSARFALAVSRIVNHYIVSAHNWYIASLWMQNQNLHDNNQQLLADNQALQAGAEMDAFILEKTIAPRVVPPTRVKRKNELFFLYRVGDLTYYAIRCQQASLAARKRYLRWKYLNAVNVFSHSPEPNAINLFNRLKEEIKCRGVKFTKNLIIIKNTKLTELELVNCLELLASDRIK